ncbi:Transcriptional regulator, TetR family [[Actinomadura] parvosata subsp. kistnae]|uniref:TetR/AcrR family transcriptional regulator n=1 Tax=[Actinomadura] parvosata TaxID=1955412 RepID=UPI000D281849|nr:Transcriptional regulator, TetR family [Actinomadura parvosata subsp. kistnae]
MSIKPVRPERRGRRRLGTENPEVQRRLLDAAGQIIATEGWPALRIDDLVRRAGLSVGTFYLYFDNKADLFVQLVVRHTERLRARLREAYAGDGTAAERLDRALDAYLDFVTETGPGFLHFRNAGNIETTVGPLSTWAFRQHADDLRPLLETAMAEGRSARRRPTSSRRPSSPCTSTSRPSGWSTLSGTPVSASSSSSPISSPTA